MCLHRFKTREIQDFRLLDPPIDRPSTRDEKLVSFHQTYQNHISCVQSRYFMRCSLEAFNDFYCSHHTYERVCSRCFSITTTEDRGNYVEINDHALYFQYHESLHLPCYICRKTNATINNLPDCNACDDAYIRFVTGLSPTELRWFHLGSVEGNLIQSIKVTIRRAT